MTADIVNLNKFRKAREWAGDAKQADENRTRFGRSKAEREKAACDERTKNRVLDDAQLPPRRDDSHDDLDPGNTS